MSHRKYVQQAFSGALSSTTFQKNDALVKDPMKNNHSSLELVPSQLIRLQERAKGTLACNVSKGIAYSGASAVAEQRAVGAGRNQRDGWRGHLQRRSCIARRLHHRQWRTACWAVHLASMLLELGRKISVLFGLPKKDIQLHTL